MHENIPHSEVIWYDSVLNTGELKWQNKLNLKNRVFFDACDGIFLNYNWSVSDLQDSIDISGADRQFDIYVGVDVFGRGCFGGGGWNTYKAMQVIRDKKLSAAIFAPGWVMEKFDRDDFDKNNQKFWELLTSYLYPHYVTSLPLTSSFCRGYGKQVFINGEMVRDQPWTNLSAQSLQPTFSCSFYQLGPKQGMTIGSVDYDTSTAFNGGGCLRISGKVTPQAEQTRTVFRMFKTDVSLQAEQMYSVSYTFKSSSNLVNIFLLLVFENQPTYMVFVCDNNAREKSESSCGYTIPKDQQENYVMLTTDTTSKQQSWITRTYAFTIPNAKHLQEIRFACTTGGSTSLNNTTTDFELNIGEVKIGLKEDFLPKASCATNLRCRNINLSEEDDKLQPSFVVSWNYQISDTTKVPKCFDIFVEGVCDQGYFIKEKLSDKKDVQTESADQGVDTKLTKYTSKKGLAFIGRAFAESYFVDVIAVPVECNDGLKVIVQSISNADVRNDACLNSTILVKW